MRLESPRDEHDRNPSDPRVAGLRGVGLVAAVGVLAVVLGDGLARWVGGAAILAAAPPLIAPALRHPWWEQRRARLPLLLTLVFATVLLSELILGHPPASRDHALHYFEIRLLVTELLPQGRVTGWTTTFNNGLAFGEAYPWFGHLWSALPHLLTGGLVELRTSYAWGLLAMWTLSIGGVWVVARTVAEELDPADRSLARWAAALGAIAWLLDPGASRQGGWNYLMFHGVWPQLLSSALWVAALPLAWRAFKRPSPRRLALAALTLGGSLLAHPFGLLTFVCSAAVWMAVLLATPSGRALPGGRILWWLVVHSIGAVIGFGWLASFFAGADSLGRSPVPWQPLGSLSADLLSGSLFYSHWMWVGPLAVVGLWFAARRGGAFAWLTAGLVLGMLVLGSQEAITVLRLDLIVAGFKNLQFPRYSIAIKPLLFAMAGVGGALTFRALRQRIGPVSARTLPERFLGALVLAPMLLSLLADPGWLIARPIGGIDSLEHAGADQDSAELTEALREEAERLGERELTVAFLREGMGGGLYPAIAVADAGGKLVMDGHVATINTLHRVRSRTPRALLGLGVTHVVYDRKIDEEEEAKLAAALHDIGQYGVYTLARLEPESKVLGTDRVSWIGDAQVEVVEEQTGRWVVDVQEVGGPVTLRLPDAPHPKWQATFDGEPIELDSAPRWGGAVSGIAIPLDRRGRLEVEFVDTLREQRARWAALAAATLCLVGLFAGASVELRRPEPSPRRDRALLAAGLAVALAGLLLVERQVEGQLENTWEEIASEHKATKRAAGATLIRDAVMEGEVSIERSWDVLCTGLWTKDAQDGCHEAQHRPRVSFLYRAPYLYRCVLFTVPAHGWAEVRLDPAEEDHWVLGTLTRLERKGKGRKLKFGRGEKMEEVGNHRHDFAVPPGAATDGLILRIENTATREEQLCMSAARIELDD